MVNSGASVRRAPLGKSRKQLAEYLGKQRRLPGTTIALQPVLVSFERRPYEKAGWSYEYGDEESFLGHHDSLYEVTIDGDETGETIHRFIDSIHAARALVDRLIYEEIAAVPVDSKWIPKSRCVLVAELKKHYQVQTHPSGARDDFDNLFVMRTGTSGRTDWLTWQLAPIFLEDEGLLYAALFLRASFIEYTFLGDEIEEAIIANDGPLFVHDAVRAENAVHNAYKVIEAIWGGNLPKDVAKIERGLRDKGIDPHAMVGYGHHGIHPKEQLVAKVLALQKARNERTAHGRINAGRKSTFYEIMDYQALAQAALAMHIRHLRPGCGL
jgi:hypothetical protein